MSYKVKAIPKFEKELKRLAKKYHSNAVVGVLTDHGSGTAAEDKAYIFYALDNQIKAAKYKAI